MASSNLTTELEELINKCEFENKQYVRAISQEIQLTENIEQVIGLKTDEIEYLQTSLEQMDEETKQLDKQFTHNKENIENLKKTSDILTEHVHAMENKHEDMKAKRREEKLSHDQQIQHFQDIWTKYKAKYESFPLAVQLKKLKDEIQQTEDLIEQKMRESEKLNEEIRITEDAHSLMSLDWKTFIIKLAENRVCVSQLNEEIKRRKGEITKPKTLENNHVEMQEHTTCTLDESNVKKMSEMQISVEDRSENDGNKIDTEMCSPMISVLGDREDEQVEVMQIDHLHGENEQENGMDVSKNSTLQQHSDVSPSPHETRPLISDQLNQKDDSPDEFHSDIETTNKENLPKFPFASYKRTGQEDGTYQGKVDLHLHDTNNKMQPQQTARLQENQGSNKYQVKRENVQFSVPNIRQTTFTSPDIQKTPTIQMPVSSKMPLRPIQMSSGINPARPPFKVPVPTISYANKGPTVSPYQSFISKPPQGSDQPLEMSSVNMAPSISRQFSMPSIQVPKISPASVPSIKPSMTNRSVKPVTKVPKLENNSKTIQQESQISSSFQIQQDYRKPSVVQANLSKSMDNTVRKPEMLKVQTTKVLKSFTPQPSPCPAPIKRVNPKPCTSPQKPEICVPQTTDKFAKLPSPQKVSTEQNILPPGNVYYVAVKGSPEKSTDSNNCVRQSPENTQHVSGRKKNASSPFTVEKHLKNLEALKNSPGYDQCQTGNKMFTSEDAFNKTPVPYGGGDNAITASPRKQPINTAVFGGAKQPAGDNLYTATPVDSSGQEGQFNFFAFHDSPGISEPNKSTFTLFGEADKEETTAGSDGFCFNYDIQDNTKSPNVLSMFGNADSVKTPPGFSFRFKREESNSPYEGNFLSLLGDSSNDDQADGETNDGFSFNFGQSSAASESMFSLFGSSDRQHREDKPFSFTFN